MPGPNGKRTRRPRDPDVEKLFANDDPEQIFCDLREIGHGNFGAVYYARNVETKEIVAIKKMSFQGKQSTDKWQDIVREVKFLQLIKHPNCVEYKSCYLRERDHTAWLVMEYCLGSAADILEVHKQPLREEEIGAICVEVLHGLEYLHNQGFIHRDVKAGNILLTDTAAVKLADFGSASITSPANSFVGTPHWMAPEVILAMDDGQYDGKVDVWSLGITCIELAERKPPLFNMNVMSALYHIGQNEAPRLAQSGDWSDDFRLFVTTCLTKNPNERLDVAGCLQDPFIFKPRPVTILPDLIERTKVAAREHDNAVARRFERMLIAVAEGDPGINLSESTYSLNVMDSMAGDSIGGGSGSGSIGSRSSLQNGSVGALKETNRNGGLSSSSSLNTSSSDVMSFASRQSATSLPGAAEKGDNSNVRRRPVGGVAAGPAAARQNNFATFRTSRILQKQQREHEIQNRMREEAAGGYNRLRRLHQKIFRQTHDRLEAELTELKQQLDKEFEDCVASLQTQLRTIEQRHERDRDGLRRAAGAEELKVQRSLQPTHDAEMKQLLQQQKKDYARMKENLRKGSGNARGDVSRNQKDAYKQQQAKAADALTQRHRQRIETELCIIRRRSMIREAELERTQLEELIVRRREHITLMHKMQLAHHEAIREREQNHLAALQHLRCEQIRAQHDAELTNQREYTKRLQQELNTRHAAAQKQVPKNMKVVEQDLRRQYQESVKAEEKKYRSRRDEIMARLPKTEQRDAIKRLKEERARHIAILAEQFENTLAENLDQQTIHLNTAQTADAAELQRRLQEEADQLTQLQAKALQQIEMQHQRELKELGQKIQIRQTLLDQKQSAEKNAFECECEAQRNDLSRRQQTRLQEFDLRTATAGLDLMHIVEVTEPPSPGSSSTSSAVQPQLRPVAAPAVNRTSLAPDVVVRSATLPKPTASEPPRTGLALGESSTLVRAPVKAKPRLSKTESLSTSNARDEKPPAPLPSSAIQKSDLVTSSTATVAAVPPVKQFAAPAMQTAPKKQPVPLPHSQTTSRSEESADDAESTRL
jgi:thousand and one amino acid protein kinase